MATRPRFDPSTLVTSLDQILAWHRKNAPALAATLSPGLSRAEIAEFARKRNTVLPEEVYVLYEWRNGMRERMPFFDIYQLLPLSEAFKYGDMLREAAPGEPYRLPILASILSNDAYYVECPRRPRATAPVGLFLEGASPDMDSLNIFIQAIAAAFEKNVFTPKPDGGLETDERELQRTMMDFRPRRKADMETVLRGEATSLPIAHQAQAHGDLVLTENPRAEDLISR